MVSLYNELLKLGYLYDELYEMTIKELSDTLTMKKQGLAYELWKSAYLTTLGISDLLKGKNDKSNFPMSVESASPELFPKPVTIEMPEVLRSDKRGRKI